MSNWSSRSGCEFVWKFYMAIFYSFIMRWGWYAGIGLILHCKNCYRPTSWNLCSKMSKMWSILLHDTVKIRTLIKIVYIKIQKWKLPFLHNIWDQIVCLCQKLSRDTGPSQGNFIFAIAQLSHLMSNGSLCLTESGYYNCDRSHSHSASD